MLLTQPAYCSACPQPIKSLGSFDIRAFIKRAVTCKHTARQKYGHHLSECCELIGHKVDGITEECYVYVAHDRREVLCVSLNEFCFCSHFLHTLAGAAQCFC